MQRLDKYLSDAKCGSRKEIRQWVRSGAVCVNAVVASAPEQKIDEQTDAVTLFGAAVQARRMLVLLLYKPAGFVTSTDDPRDRTVMELLPEQYRAQEVFPVGRLDKQTEGLLLLTNDGELAHRLISPKYDVPKVYYAEHEGTTNEADVEAFRLGVELKDGTSCRPAILEALGEGKSLVTVTEGKYHQVRRMLASRAHSVSYLRREREGKLTLEGMQPGQVRELTQQEIAGLYD